MADLHWSVEEPFTFTVIEDPDGWEASRGGSVVVKGIASLKNSPPVPGKATGVQASVCKGHFRMDALPSLTHLTIGDTFTVRGVEYQITNLDLRGVRPTEWKLCVEGSRRS